VTILDWARAHPGQRVWRLKAEPARKSLKNIEVFE
jgi:hypothetical protein